MNKTRFENLDLSFSQSNLLQRLKKKDKEDRKKKKLESIKIQDTINTKDGNQESCSSSSPKKRGRKATGRKVLMITLTLSQEFHKKIEEYKEKREGALGKSISIQKVIKEILIEHFDGIEQMHLFQQKL